MEQINQAQGRAFVEVTFTCKTYEHEYLSYKEYYGTIKEQRVTELTIAIMESFNLSPQEVDYDSMTGPVESEDCQDVYTTTYEVNYSQLVKGTIQQDLYKNLNEFLSLIVGPTDEYNVYICDHNSASDWLLENY